MEFLGVGYQEILLILVLMLVVVGPSRLPTVAYQLGKAVRTLQGYARVVRDEFSEEIAYIQQEADSVRGELTSAQQQLREADQELRREQAEISREVAQTSTEVKRDVSGSLSDTNVVSLPSRRQDATSTSSSRASATPARPRDDQPPSPPLVF